MSVGQLGLFEKFFCLCLPGIDHGSDMHSETVTVGHECFARDYVIESAESILKRLQRVQRSLLSFDVLMTRKDAAKKIYHVA